MSDNIQQLTVELCSLGDSVLSSLKSNADDSLTLLEQYADKFDCWNTAWESANKSDNLDVDGLQRLLDIHESICRGAQKLTDEATASLRSLRGWSKGIRAYIDHYPSKISTRRGKKG